MSSTISNLSVRQYTLALASQVKNALYMRFINDAAGHNYIQYELDGAYQKRLKVTGNIVSAS
jgi:hypothetical protein